MEEEKKVEMEEEGVWEDFTNHFTFLDISDSGNSPLLYFV